MLNILFLQILILRNFKYKEVSKYFNYNLITPRQYHCISVTLTTFIK